MLPRKLKIDSTELAEITNELVQFLNCLVLRSGGLKKEHIWVRNGRILDERTVFFEEKTMADVQVI